MIQTELNQSQDTEKIIRGLSTDNSMNNHYNSHHQGHRKIESSFNANSYINNSSVAKTAMQTRRNISFGGNNDWANNIVSDRGIDTANTAQLNGISRPNIKNTYDGSSYIGAIKTTNAVSNNNYH